MIASFDAQRDGRSSESKDERAQGMRRLLCKRITGLLPIVKVHDDRRRSREPKSFERLRGK